MPFYQIWHAGSKPGGVARSAGNVVVDKDRGWAVLWVKRRTYLGIPHIEKLCGGEGKGPRGRDPVIGSFRMSVI